jgi:hypothetical protein
MDILQTIFMEVNSTKQAQDIDKPRRESALSLSLLWTHLLVQLNKSCSNARIQVACSSEVIRRLGEAPLDFETIGLNYGWSTHPVLDPFNSALEEMEHLDRQHRADCHNRPRVRCDQGPPTNHP